VAHAVVDVPGYPVTFGEPGEVNFVILFFKQFLVFAFQPKREFLRAVAKGNISFLKLFQGDRPAFYKIGKAGDEDNRGAEDGGSIPNPKPTGTSATKTP
jgi:hypothetical protein